MNLMKNLVSVSVKVESNTVTYRLYGKEQTVNMGIDEFVNHVLEDIKEKKLVRD